MLLRACVWGFLSLSGSVLSAQSIALTSVAPNSGTAGSTISVTLTGSNFGANPTVMVSGTGVVTQGVALVNATQITATLAIAADAIGGARTVTVTSAGVLSNGQTFTVNLRPTLSTIAPGSGAAGSSVSMTLTGDNFATGSFVNVSGGGVTLQNVIVVSPTQITATVEIGADAAAGPRTVTVTSSGLTSNGQTFAVNLVPTLSSVSPGTGTPGSTVPITLSGANFGSGSIVNVSGSGVVPQSVTIVNAGQITATLAIAAGAATDAHTITVTSVGLTSGGQVFAVSGLDSAAPSSARQGQTVGIVLTGLSTHFVDGTTRADFGTGITVNSVSVKDATHVTANITIASAASTGPVPVKVTTGSEVVSSTGIFTVNPAGPPTVTLRPLTGKPGDTLNLIVTADNCPADPTAKGWLNKDSLTVSGSDVVLTYRQNNDECSVTYSAVIAAKPISREATLRVTGVKPNTNPPTTTSLGNSVFRILDAPVIPPGPIPPGLSPQVDVMWSIMSAKTCADEFGSRLAKFYYCIDVVLGNNSGYPLILAAVGFLRHIDDTEYRDPTASYLSTRSTVQQGQVYSARALTLSTLQGAGAIIAGTAPFSGNAGRKGRLAIWSTLVGTVAAGVAGSVIPDHTIKEDTALDDAALRDGKLIPNNSPVRFTVFVDRDTIMPLLLRRQEQLLTDAAAADRRADELSPKIAVEVDPAKLNDLKKERSKWREWAREMRIEAGAHKEEDYVKVKGAMINPIRHKKALLSDNLISVRRALGNLIIVGDQIQYLQRVQVDSAAVVPGSEPTPVVTGQSGTVVQGTAGDIVLVGSGLAKANQVTALQCASNINPPINAQPDPSGSSVTLKGFTVTGCKQPAIPLLVSNGSGSFVYNLPITSVPQLDTPATTTLTLGSNNQVVFHLTGKDLTGATPSIALTNGSSTTTLTPASTPPLTVANSSPTTLDVTATLSGDYLRAGTTAKVTISTAAGGPSAPVSFTIQPSP